MVVGIMVGTGIFRTPGIVVGELGRPALVLLLWIAGGALACLGALVFAELSTRFPHAGGKYVYAREAYGPRAALVVGWVEGLGIYPVAIAAIGVVAGEFTARLLGWPPGASRWLGTGLVVLLTGVNLVGVGTGRRVQNLVTGAKVLALAGVVAAAFVAGDGAGWHGTASAAPSGTALWGAFALAFQAVIWTYYGYPDAAKIAEEVVDPGRVLPRVFLIGLGVVTALYLLLNAAFFNVLPLDHIASSNLVPGDVMAAIFGGRAGALMAAVALLIVLASLNGNIFVTPRVLFGLARDGLAPGALARVNRGGTPWAAMLVVGAVSVALAATGTFQQLLSLAITLILLVDGFTVTALFPLRRRNAAAPFRVPLYPAVPVAFLAVYAALFIATVVAQPMVAALGAGVLVVAYLVARAARR